MICQAQDFARHRYPLIKFLKDLLFEHLFCLSFLATNQNSMCSQLHKARYTVITLLINRHCKPAVLDRDRPRAGLPWCPALPGPALSQGRARFHFLPCPVAQGRAGQGKNFCPVRKKLKKADFCLVFLIK